MHPPYNSSMVHLWGTSHVQLQEQNLLFVLAEAHGGGAASSLHYHDVAANGILVLEGTLIVEWEPASHDGSQQSRFELGPQCGLMVPPRQPHRLVFPGPVRLAEWYTTPPGMTPYLEDIVRLKPGWRKRT